MASHRMQAASPPGSTERNDYQEGLSAQIRATNKDYSRRDPASTDSPFIRTATG